MREETLLEIDGLSVTVATDEGVAGILDHASLTLKAGSIHGVVGESGCGKSTLLKAILGILPRRGRVTSGSIAFEGRELTRLSATELQRDVRGRAIGFIPQDPFQALNPVFRAGTQLTEALRARVPGRAERERRVAALLEAVQLADAGEALERYPHQFSGGQRQRLLIAAALAIEPRVLLADEPTTALDVTTQMQILRLLADLSRERGLAMLLVTHDFGVVAQLCDHVTVMYAGQTVESGPVGDVLARPIHPYTEALIACHPERAETLGGIPGAVPSPLAPPSGCRFHPRCAKASAVCATARPRTSEPRIGHRVACVLHDGAARS